MENNSMTSKRDPLQLLGQNFATVLRFAGALVVSQNKLWAADPESGDPTPQVESTVPVQGEMSVNDIEKSVVKIFATVRYPDLIKPWTTQPPEEITGSGVVI